ncbi:hypothetical protein EPUS_05146 [Endocarpon pusillum Z07020]|uniref:Dienelactone hydrolase domain-containing protein n=1 Tax=Endocarpon pusillum (strain Z07020 / HMAS-L-300199) TaxID=1263415 RepID=U1GRD5_ENDPU|nr:uncharacterized protein EPUS_05146 [Endocarpon pusillum Z07020]ERF74938.1 hypothetical protein EPUS_05146 [Endocarpon pusillum Z07020]
MSSSPPLATKTPESDAQEPPTTTTSTSIFPQDSPAQSGPSMGGMDAHCTTDRPSPSSQTPTGELTKFNDDIDVYISKPADYPHSPSKLLLLLTPGTGVKSTNNQLQADRYAGEGFVVVMPDQFGGDPAPNTTASAAESASNGGEENVSLIEQVKLRAAETAKSFMIDMWLARHTPEKVAPILHKVLESAKDEFADAVANGGGVYAAGYCFGGKYVMMLAGKQQGPETEGRHEEEVKADRRPLIKAGAIAHATLVTREDITAIEAPVSIVCVENDQLFPEDILEEGRKHLQNQNIDHEIKTYPGVPHGFAVVGEYENPKIKDAQTAAFEQMLSWLKTH